MGLHSWLFAKVYDRITRSSEDAGVREWRRALLSKARGDVLEIGAGTGLNLSHYLPGLGRLVLTELEAPMLGQLRAKAGSREGVELQLAGADRLPFEDQSFDTVVSTLVLCSVPDPAAALRELRRVLRPDGRFLFVEHVGSDDPRVARLQRRVEPFWKWFARGCHLTRDTASLLAAAGFEVQERIDEPMPTAPRFVAPCLRGVARPKR